MSEEKNNVMVLMPGDTLETIKERFKGLLRANERLTLEVTRLREKVEWYRQPCPQVRMEGEPGYTQGEARFWHEAADSKSAEVKTLEAQVEQWKKKYQEKIFAND